MASATDAHTATARTDITTEISLAGAIVEVIAAARDTDPSTIDVQLYDYIDLDALETLYAHAAASEQSRWQVRFQVEELDVTVASDGVVTAV